MKFKLANRRLRAAEGSVFGVRRLVAVECKHALKFPRTARTRCCFADKSAKHGKRQQVPARQKRRQAGFTLAEVLATLVFMAIVIPVAVQGLHVASRAGSVSVRKAVGARIAESKLNELVVTGQWQSSAQKGTIQEGWQSYSWQLQSEPWAEDGAMRLITVHVNVPVQGQDYDVRVSTLVDATQ